MDNLDSFGKEVSGLKDQMNGEIKYQMLIAMMEYDLQYHEQNFGKDNKYSDLLVEMATFYIELDKRKSIAYYEQALTIKRNLENIDKLEIINIYEKLSFSYYGENRLDDAISLLKTILTMDINKVEESRKFNYYCLIAGYYQLKKEYKDAICFFSKALKMILDGIEVNMKIGKDKLYEYIGNLYYLDGNYENALKFYEKLLVNFKSSFLPGDTKIKDIEEKIFQIKHKIYLSKTYN